MIAAGIVKVVMQYYQSPVTVLGLTDRVAMVVAPWRFLIIEFIMQINYGDRSCFNLVAHLRHNEWVSCQPHFRFMLTPASLSSRGSTAVDLEACLTTKGSTLKVNSVAQQFQSHHSLHKVLAVFNPEPAYSSYITHQIERDAM